MSRCEWKDGKFYPCNEFDPCVMEQFKEGTREGIYPFCLSCNSELTHKPGPAKPLIVKSGETWVVFWDGVNYLCFKPRDWDDIKEMDRGLCTFPEILKKHPNDWKSFTDITELTDTEAKLRPMVVINNDNGNRDTRMLTYIDENYVQCKGVTYSRSIIDASESVRLATAKELQEQNQ